MAHITNIGPCPLAVAGFIQKKLADTVRRQDEPGWLQRQFIKGMPRLGERVADVRWLSECDVTSRTCSGYLLGRWVMHAGGSQPLERDFEPHQPEPDDEGTATKADSPFHFMVYDFALPPEADKCVLVEIDLDGQVQRAAYELPDGVNSASFGPMIGDIVRERFTRDKWNVCVPAGWRPRSVDESRHSSQ